MDKKQLQPLTLKESEDKDLEDPGFLVAAEGIDGSGKSTLVKCLKQRFEDNGLDVDIFSSFSGHTAYWNTVMKMKEEMDNFPHDIDQTLHALEFITYTRTSLRELLRNNDLVLADRYLLGKLVLSRVFTRDKDAFSEKLLHHAYEESDILDPDLTLYLELSPDIAFSRIDSRGEPVEPKENTKTLSEMRNTFQDLVPQLNGVETVDASQSPQDLCDDAFKVIKSKMKGE